MNMQTRIDGKDVKLFFAEKEEHKVENHLDSQISSQLVYRTKNYDLFTPNKANRPTDMKRVHRIVEKIQAGNNLLPEYPIIVDENFVVIDGHHRLAAAKIANVDIFYRISPTMTMERAADAVAETKGWTIADRLHHFVQLGNQDYVRMNELWKSYDWLPVSILVRLCSSNSYQTPLFVEGRYKADRIDFARRVISMASDFRPYFDGWKTAPFINALAQIAGTQGYSHRRMMEKMEYLSSKLHRHSKIEHYLENLTEIYNYRAMESNKLIFRSAKKIQPINK